jgi:cytoskeletal protein RodZ
MNLKSAQTAKVGKIFKNARLQKSLSLREISTAAFINVEYIRGIESGDYSIFPARTYAIKYFEKYAKFLSINPKFFDIYNADAVAMAEKAEQARSVKKNFFEKNKIFICLLVILTLIAIIFLMISSRPIDKKSIQIIENSKILNTLESNINSQESFQRENMELNDQINSFLNTNNLDSNQVNVNVESIEPDA